MRANFVVLVGSMFGSWVLFPVSALVRNCPGNTNTDLSGTLLFENNEKCASLFETKKTWAEAMNVCRSGGGDLLKLSTHTEPGVLSASLNKGCYWVGLNDRKTEGEMLWADGSKLDTKLLRIIPPNSNELYDCTLFCRRVDHSWEFMMHACDQTFGFLCHYGMKAASNQDLDTRTTTLTPTLTPFSSTASTVTQSILPKTSPLTQERTRKPRKRQRRIQRANYFEKVTNLGKNPHIRANPVSKMRLSSAILCSAKCMEMNGCVVINFGAKLWICKLFTSVHAIEEREDNVLDWAVYMSTQPMRVP